FASVTPGGASLARGYYPIIPTGFQFDSLRSHSWRTFGLSGAGRGTLKCNQDAPSRVYSSPLVRCFYSFFHASSGERVCTRGYLALNSVSDRGPVMGCLLTSIIIQPFGSPRYIAQRLAKINPLVQPISSTVPSMQPPPDSSTPAFSR